MIDEFRYERTRLTERPKASYRYYVTGRGPFPYDMLRYDQAWPADGESAALLEGTQHRSIRLCSYQEPTIGRWQSFVWSVGLQKL